MHYVGSMNARAAVPMLVSNKRLGVHLKHQNLISKFDNFFCVYQTKFCLNRCIGSVLERLVVQNASQRTSQHVGWTSGARLTITIDRSIDRSRGRSLDQSSLGRSIAGRSSARSLGRSVARSIGHSTARAIDWSLDPIVRSLD